MLAWGLAGRNAANGIGSRLAVGWAAGGGAGGGVLQALLVAVAATTMLQHVGLCAGGGCLWCSQTAISTRPRRSTASSLRFIGRRADDGDVRVLELHAVTGLVPLGIVCVDCVLTADLLPRVVPTGVPHRAARTDSTPDCYRGARRPHGRQQICAHPPRAQGYRRTLTPQRRHPRARRHPPTASAGLTVSG